MYLVAGTAGKCIQGFPGVSFVLARTGYLEQMTKYPKRSWYLSLANYFETQEQGSVPFTPAVQVYAAFHEALNELLEEGVANRIKRYGNMAKLIRERMAKLGIQAVVEAASQSNSLTAFYLPPAFTYEHLHDRLKERGYIIYAGQGHLESKIFRVANMGALTTQDFEGFLSAFEEIIQQAPPSR
jgi:2-aminoethylphosphonate-pyruvate transaminase